MTIVEAFRKAEESKGTKAAKLRTCMFDRYCWNGKEWLQLINGKWCLETRRNRIRLDPNWVLAEWEVVDNDLPVVESPPIYVEIEPIEIVVRRQLDELGESTAERLWNGDLK